VQPEGLPEISRGFGATIPPGNEIKQTTLKTSNKLHNVCLDKPFQPQIPSCKKGWPANRMNDFRTFRKSSVRYWERRRIFLQFDAHPPAFAGYSIATTVNFVGNPAQPYFAYVLAQLAISALRANICFSFPYSLEAFSRGLKNGFVSRNFMRMKFSLAVES
jgi:hypothetical protein